MIISHKHAFIFIKVRKTASTSVEVALSNFCGPDDVLTPLRDRDEQLRRELGYRGAQNYYVPLSQYSLLDTFRSIYNRERLHFFHHCSAQFIKEHVDDRIWNSYYTFCFERNPWDKFISLYEYQTLEQGVDLPPLNQFVHTQTAGTFTDFELYSIDNKICVDEVFLYEELDDAIDTIRDRLGLPEAIQLPRTKHTIRQSSHNYREVLSPEARDEIAKMYAREIAHFGYEW